MLKKVGETVEEEGLSLIEFVAGSTLDAAFVLLGVDVKCSNEALCRDIDTDFGCMAMTLFRLCCLC